MTGAVDLRALFFDDPAGATGAMATAVLGRLPLTVRLGAGWPLIDEG